MVHPAGLEPATLTGRPLLRRRRLPISPRVHTKWPGNCASLRGLPGSVWCRTRVSLPRHTPCSAHPCQCRMQVKHGSCAAYENASCRLTKSVGGVSASLSSGIFGVAIPVVPQFLSGLFRPAFTEGGDPALLPPVGIKPNTALATAHQRRHINWKSLGTTSGLCPGALPSCTFDGSSMDYRILFAHIAGCLLPVTC